VFRLVTLWISINLLLALTATCCFAQDQVPQHQAYIGLAATKQVIEPTEIAYGPAEPQITNFMAFARTLEFNQLLKKQSELNPQWQSAQTFYLTEERAEAIRVYIQPYEGHPEITQWAKESFTEWKKALGNRLELEYVNNPSNAQIQVVWVKKEDMDDKTRLAETLPNIGFGYITVVRPSTNFIEKSPNAELAIRAVMMHEFGHALGITDHSEDECDLMAAEINMDFLVEQYAVGQRPTLRKKDIEAIQILYSPNWKPGQDLYQ
jgi:predicted Zn-dependent protease